MLNFIWAGMLIIGIVFATLNGRIALVTEAALDSAKEAISLCLTMLGAMSFWMGVMEIAMKAGIVNRLSRWLDPFVRWMFPGVSREHKAKKYITTNIVANILGLGWAATPAGLRAMEAMGEDRIDDVASNDMCNFLILNISSLQLIPMSLIAYRSQYGSVSPTRIVGAGIVATCISTFVGCVFCKIMSRKRSV
jgi:spore maturation protein A